MENNKTELELLLDPAFRELQNRCSKINVFEILNLTRAEIRHSRMLCWLLDPEENHGMGDLFLRNILNNYKCETSLNLEDFLKQPKIDKVIVTPEWKNIDILIDCPKDNVVVAIENKIGAHEHNQGKTDKSQLEAYSETLSTKYTDYNIIKLFLTPDGDEPTQDDWKILTYQDVVDALESALAKKVFTMPSEATLLVTNYIDAIKKNVIFDDALFDICNEVYNNKKYTTLIKNILKTKSSNIYQSNTIVFETIKKYSEDFATKLSNKCREILTKLDKKLVVEGSKSRTVKFRTRKIIDNLNGVNRETYRYQFEFPKDDDKYYVRCTLVVDKQNDPNIIPKLKDYNSKIDYTSKPFKVAWHSEKEEISNQDGFEKPLKDFIDSVLVEINDLDNKASNKYF